MTAAVSEALWGALRGALHSKSTGSGQAAAVTAYSCNPCGDSCCNCKLI